MDKIMHQKEDMVTIDSAPQSNFVTVGQIFSAKPAASNKGFRYNFGGIPFLSTAAFAMVWRY